MHNRSTATLLLLVGLSLTAACGKESPTQPTTTVQSVRLTASPASLPTSGGSTEITATVTLNTGAPGGGIPVAFTTDRGSFNVGSVTTDAAGTAKVRLTRTETATVRGTASGVQGDVPVDV